MAFFGLFGKSKEEKAALAAQQDSIVKSQGLADAASSANSNFLSLAGKSFTPAVDYWSSILSPNRAAATSVLAPQLSQIGDQYRAATQSASELTPRGGGRASLLMQLPYQQAHDQQSLLQTARPEAAKELGTVGGQTGVLGTGLVSNAIAALNGATDAGRSLLTYNASKSQSDRALGTTIGKSLFELYKSGKLKLPEGWGGAGAPAPAGADPGLGGRL